MTLGNVIEHIDAEIAKLQQAKSLLSGSPDIAAEVFKTKRGRPKGSKNTAVKSPAKRTMSAEGRAKVAAAQKKRWAAAKNSA